MNIDIKSVLIGVLLTINIMMLMGFNSKSIEDHTHDSTEITYKKYGYAKYGTLKKKIQDIEGNMYSFAKNYHNHHNDDSIYPHTHSRYTDSFHTH